MMMMMMMDVRVDVSHTNSLVGVHTPRLYYVDMSNPMPCCRF